MSNNEQKLREALAALCAHLQVSAPGSERFNEALDYARYMLAATESKHPAIVAWEEHRQPVHSGCWDDLRAGFLAGYRAGMLAAEKLIDRKYPEGHGFCETVRQLIRDAANQVPKE